MKDGWLTRGLYWISFPLRLLALGVVWVVLRPWLPKLPKSTIETYLKLFRGNLHGTWDSAEYCVTPIDCAARFDKDGNGWSSSGASGMFGAETRFKWRQVDDFAIEVRSHADENWTRLDYGFSKVNDRVEIHFAEVGDGPDWIFDLVGESMALSRK